jgi:hypothetical protein
MALSETRIANKIIAIIDELQQETDDPNGSKENFAKKLAQVIVEEIKEAKIIYINGLVAPNGPVTGTRTHTVS